MAEYRKFIATPSKVTMMNTLQDCLHDIYSKRPADPLLALSLRLQNKIATRSRQNTNDGKLLSEIARLSDENHRMRLLLSPEGMDMAESMEQMQFTAKQNRDTITGLENDKDGLKAEIVSLNHRLRHMKSVIAEKDALIAQYAKSLNKLYGCEETEAVIKIQAVQRGVAQRQAKLNDKDSVEYESDEASDEESGDAEESDDDHHFDGEMHHIDAHLSVGRRHNHKIKSRRRQSKIKSHRMVIQKREAKTKTPDSQVDSDEVDLADLDREINAMLSDDDREVTAQLDNKLKEILDDVDLDDAIEAATKIQALARGHAGRSGVENDDGDDDEGVQALEEYLETLTTEEVESAVLKIQALARGRMVRNKVDEVSTDIHVGPQLEPDVEALQCFLEDKDEHRVNRSASVIQANFRGRSVRRRVKRKRQEEKAATHIQRIYRGKSARVETQKRRRLSKMKPQSALKEVSPLVVGPDDE